MESDRAESEPTGEEYAYLIGHTSLREHLEFMTTEPIGAESADLKQLSDAWRAAREAYRKLQEKEADWADDHVGEPIPEPMRGWVDRVHADPIFHRAFAAVPVTLGLVELDRLIVTQKTINVDHVRRLAAKLGDEPDDEDVFRLCLPTDHEVPATRVARLSDSEFVFISESSDLRFLDAALLRPDQVPGFGSFGPVTGLVGLVVGFGSNYLNAIACQGRMVLNNGFHRAFALRGAGATRVPCVIQQVTSLEELGVVGNSALKRDPEVYLERPRPPVLKDFFHPRMCSRVLLTPTRKHVRVSFAVEERDLP